MSGFGVGTIPTGVVSLSTAAEALTQYLQLFSHAFPWTVAAIIGDGSQTRNAPGWLPMPSGIPTRED